MVFRISVKKQLINAKSINSYLKANCFRLVDSISHELSSKTNEKRLDSAIKKLKTGSSFQNV